MGGRLNSNSKIHSISVPYEHLRNNTYSVGSTQVLEQYSYGSHRGKTVNSKKYTLKYNDSENQTSKFSRDGIILAKHSFNFFAPRLPPKQSTTVSSGEMPSFFRAVSRSVAKKSCRTGLPVNTERFGYFRNSFAAGKATAYFFAQRLSSRVVRPGYAFCS